MTTQAMLRNILNTWQRVWDLIPITGAGVCLLALSYWVYTTFGDGESDYILLVAGGIGGVIVGAAVCFTLLGAAILTYTLQRTRVGPPLTLSMTTGTARETGFRFNTLLWLPFVEVTMRWVEPAHVETTLKEQTWWMEEVIRPRERGRLSSITRRFELRDVFGLTSFAFRMRWPAVIDISPVDTALDASVAFRDVSGDGYAHPAGEHEGDRVEMRHYGPGDPVRFILWKTFARTRRLLVRTPERALIPQRSTVAVMIAGLDDEATASAARTFVEKGLLGDQFEFLADGADSLVDNPADSLDHLIDSAQHRDQGGDALMQVLHQVESGRLGQCVIFVPSTLGTWFDKLDAFVRQVPQPPTLVVAVDGEVSAPTQRPRWSRWLRRPPQLEATQDLRHVPRLYDRLQSLGGPVMVLHRPTGQHLDEYAIDALRAL